MDFLRVLESGTVPKRGTGCVHCPESSSSGYCVLHPEGEEEALPRILFRVVVISSRLRRRGAQKHCPGCLMMSEVRHILGSSLPV